METLKIIFFCFLSINSIFSQDYWEQKDSVNGPPKAASSAFSLGSIGMVVGGLDELEFKRKSYVYSPFQDDWDETTSLGGVFGDGLQRASSCGFSIENNGLIKGYVALGQTQTIPFMNDLWEFDPITESWSQKADFIGSPRRQAVSFVIESNAYVGTGEGITGLFNDFYVYNSETNEWSQITDFPGTPRRQAIAFSLAGNGFVGTGDDGVKKNDFWMFNPQTSQWILKAQFPGPPRSGACAWSSYPSAFIATGEDMNFSFLNDLYEYNYWTNSWTQRTDLPGPPRKNAFAFCINDVGYIGTGYNDNFLDDFYAYHKIADVSENTNLFIDVYPNPAQEMIYLKTDNSEIQSVKFLNLTGEIVFEKSELNQSFYELNVGQFPNGIYHVFVQLSDDKIVMKMISKL